MSSAQVALLGAIAGFTIFLGLPFGRMRQPSPRLRAGLNGVAIGILIFLVWDILGHAWEPTDLALADHDWGTAAAGLATLAVGLAVGLLGLTYVDARIAARRARTLQPVVAGAASAPEPAGVLVRTRPVVDTETAGMHLALMIAMGIGLHNFAEGLAIGNSAASGDLSLALLLVIGFGLHNATEGFGIVAPLTGSTTPVSWGRLALLGVVGGGPTFVGTVIGQWFVGELLSVAFLALAAGSVLYVVIELLATARRARAKALIAWTILAGLLLGFVTDGILIAAGA